MPLTGGFFGKFYIFKAALDAHLVWLTVLGLLNSAVAAYYYLRILVVVYMREPGAATENLPPLSAGVQATLSDLGGWQPWSSASFRPSCLTLPTSPHPSSSRPFQLLPRPL